MCYNVRDTFHTHIYVIVCRFNNLPHLILVIVNKEVLPHNLRENKKLCYGKILQHVRPQSSPRSMLGPYPLFLIRYVLQFWNPFV